MAISDAWLTEKVSQRHITITKYADYLWLLDARGVAYLPACDWLIVSDLHLEKGSYLRSYANPLPSLDIRSRSIAKHTAQRLLNILSKKGQKSWCVI